MTPQHYQLACELFREALDLTEDERLAILHTRRVAPEVIDILQSLLDAVHGTAGDETLSLSDSDETLEPGPSMDSESAWSLGPSPHSERYEIQGRVAAGGMGEVVRVWDRDLRRQLAMKIMKGPSPRGADPSSPSVSQARRFVDEAQIAGQLEHPGVVPVHELGVDDTGKVYFTMRLVRGETLSDVFAKVSRNEGSWTMTRALGTILRACETMAYAHSRGVLHRDLKPANIMVGEYGETYVMDWGLAKIDGDPPPDDQAIDLATIDTHSPPRVPPNDHAPNEAPNPLTVQGDVIGTPSYMPPEQARGDLEAISKQSDVYSMGAVLYQLLTGKPPYVTDHPIRAHSLLDRVLTGPPALSATLAPQTPPELAAICDKAMAREPHHRYPDIGAMAEDLRAFLEQRVVRAYKTGPWIEFQKWVRRNRRTASFLAALIVSAIGLSIWIAQLERRARQAEQEKSVEIARTRDEANTVIDYLVASYSPQPLDTAQSPTHAKDLLLNGLQRIRDDKDTHSPSLHARLLTAMGLSLSGLDAHAESAQTLEDALTLSREHLGASHQDTLEALQALGHAHKRLGSFDDAERILSESLDTHRTHLGDDHEGVFTSMLGLADLKREQSLYEEAEAIYLEALDTFQNVIHAHGAAMGMQELGRLYVSMHRFEDAHNILEEALAYTRERLGPEHPQTVTTMTNLANVLHRLGRHQDAESLYRDALTIQREEDRHADPHTLRTVEDLASLHREQGQHGKTVNLYREVLKHPHIGEHHPQSLATRSRLSQSLSLAGDLPAAIAECERAERAARDVLGPIHSLTLQIATQLGELYRAAKRHKDAQALFHSLLKDITKRFGPQNAEAIAIEYALAWTLYDFGQMKEARIRFLHLTSKGEEHVRQTPDQDLSSCLASSYEALASIAEQEENWNEALRHQEASLRHTATDNLDYAPRFRELQRLRRLAAERNRPSQGNPSRSKKPR